MQSFYETTSCCFSNAPLITIFFGTTTPIGPGPPHSWVFWIKHNDAPQSVGLLWTSDQLVAEAST